MSNQDHKELCHSMAKALGKLSGDIDSIISILEKGNFNHMVWVGKNYNKQELVDGLRQIADKLDELNGVSES